MPAITPYKKGDDVFYSETGWVSFPLSLKKASKKTFTQEVLKYAPLAAAGVLVGSLRGRR